MGNLAGLLASTPGRTAESDGYRSRALAIRETLADRHPENVDFTLTFLSKSSAQASSLAQQKNYEAARQAYERILVRTQESLKTHPEQRALKNRLVVTRSELAHAWLDLGNHARAAEVIQQLPVSLDPSYSASTHKTEPTASWNGCCIASKWDDNWSIARLGGARRGPLAGSTSEGRREVSRPGSILVRQRNTGGSDADPKPPTGVRRRHAFRGAGDDSLHSIVEISGASG